MIFDTDKEKDAKQIGDIKNNNVSIDTNNIDFIVTILSTNLYSKPIESFIRETVSNAWDSHVEAKVDDPVILELGIDTEGNYFCRIQDFGVGLSPERFDKVYKNIGSSTKRSDNTQIGGFGIGRFSALAYSDVVHITSVFEGTKYYYMMYKDGNSISIDMLHKRDTEERNGLEVKVEIKPGDFENFTRAIKSQLVYFENLYVIDSTTETPELLESSIQTQYNNFSVAKYENFWVNSLDKSKEVNLLLGKVRYPVRLYSLEKTYSDKISKYPISLLFDIGDLDVTPNREEVLYSSKNKKVIQEKLDLALLEIDTMAAKQKSLDFSTVPEYLEALQEKQYLSLLEVEGDSNIRIKLSDSKKEITLNGENFDGESFTSLYAVIMAYRGIRCTYRLRNFKIKYEIQKISLNSLKSSFSNNFIADLGAVKNITKRYVRETFEDQARFLNQSKSIKGIIIEYYDHAKNYEDRYNRNLLTSYNKGKEISYEIKAFKVLVRYILSNMSKIPTFDDSYVPSSWIAETKAADKLKRAQVKKAGFDWKQNINVHILRKRDYGGGVTTDSTPRPMEGLGKAFKDLTIYDEKSSERLTTLFNYLKPEVRPKMVTVAPTKIKLLKNVDNFVKFDEFMSTKYTLFRNLGTVEFLRREIPFLKDLAKIRNLGEISEKLALATNELSKFVIKYESALGRHADKENEKLLIDEVYDVCEGENYFNEQIIATFNLHKKELLNAEFLINMAPKEEYSHTVRIPSKRINMLVDYVLARKLIRPSLKAVLKLKEETIYNIIKPIEEDENNQN